jgi:uroporphyrinogen III methyltransferase/synthase
VSSTAAAKASACAAGIPFEVVPGVSSAIGALAYAGIPVTDRRHSASFAVVTGHKDPGEVAAETRWEALAHAADTLVILMGMRNLEALLARLLAAGRSPATPAAAVMDGGLPRNGSSWRRWRSSPACAMRASAPAVVGRRWCGCADARWFREPTLFGQRVSSRAAATGTRPQRRCDAPGRAVVLPLLAIVLWKTGVRSCRARRF